MQPVHIFLAIVSYTKAANILAVYPTPSSSHQIPLQTVTRALADDGHNVTVITPMPANISSTNYHEVDVSSKIFWLDKNSSISFQRRIHEFEMIWLIPGFSRAIMESQFNQTSMRDFMRWSKSVKFDLIIFESLSRTSYFAFAHKFGNVSYIGIRTVNPVTYFDSGMGNINNPSFVPMAYTPHTFKMSFQQRLRNTLVYLFLNFVRHFYLIPDQEELKKEYLGNDMPDTIDLEEGRSLLIIIDDLFNNVMPVFPNIIFTGPVHLTKPKELPPDLKNWVNTAPQGIIYFSLGTNTLGKYLPRNVQNIFIDVFKKFPEYHFIWKFESETKKLDNIYFVPWTPQQDILANSRTKLFITQGGLQSCQETIEYAVPVLGIPIFADQDTNVAKLVGYEMALALEIDDITHQLLYSSIYKLLNDRRYKENAERMSKISKDRDMPPIRKAVWWVNHILRHNGGNHLRPPTYDLALYQYLLLDIILVIFILMLVPVIVSVCCLRKIFSGKNTVKKTATDDKQKSE